MFAKSVIDSDAFLELPARCQLLYFHLGMRADDDGFVNKARAILRLTGCTEADMKTLIAAQYLISFPSGVVVIRHWKIHNYIRSDRLRPTVYEEEKAMLLVENTDFAENCYLLADKKFGCVPEEPRERQKMAASLARYGYGPEEIKFAMKKLS